MKYFSYTSRRDDEHSFASQTYECMNIQFGQHNSAQHTLVASSTLAAQLAADSLRPEFNYLGTGEVAAAEEETKQKAEKNLSFKPSESRPSGCIGHHLSTTSGRQRINKVARRRPKTAGGLRSRKTPSGLARLALHRLRLA